MNDKIRPMSRTIGNINIGGVGWLVDDPICIMTIIIASIAVIAEKMIEIDTYIR